MDEVNEKVVTEGLRLIDKLLEGSVLRKGVAALIASAVGFLLLKVLIPSLDFSAINGIIFVFGGSLYLTLVLLALEKFKRSMARVGLLLILSTLGLLGFLLLGYLGSIEQQYLIHKARSNTTEIGNLIWLNKNLNVYTSSSWCWDDENRCISSGRYYTQEAAEKACKLLGKEWRLPDTSEFRLLIADATTTNNAESRFTSITDVNNPFHLSLDGNRYWLHESKKRNAFNKTNKDQLGFYWTKNTLRTKDFIGADIWEGYAIRLNKSTKGIRYAENYPRENSFSCRCVKTLKNSN